MFFFVWIFGELVKNISLYLYVLLSSIAEILWRKKNFLTDLEAMKAVDNYFGWGLKCKMYYGKVFNQKIRHLTGNFSSIFQFSKPMLNIQASKS